MRVKDEDAYCGVFLQRAKFTVLIRKLFLDTFYKNSGVLRRMFCSSSLPGKIDLSPSRRFHSLLAVNYALTDPRLQRRDWSKHLLWPQRRHEEVDVVKHVNPYRKTANH